MAFSLPSFNAAVASAQTSGVPLQRLQANIDFNDVKSTLGTEAMVRVPFEQFAMESAVARDALQQMAMSQRQTEALDAAMEIEQFRADRAKKEALISNLLGGGQGGRSSGSSMLSPLEKQLQMRRMLTELDRHDKEEIGIFDPDLGVRSAAEFLPGGQLKTGVQAPAVVSPKVETTPQAQPTPVSSLTELLKQQLNPDKK